MSNQKEGMTPRVPGSGTDWEDMRNSPISWVPLAWLVILGVAVYWWMGGSIPVLDDILRRLASGLP